MGAGREARRAGRSPVIQVSAKVSGKVSGGVVRRVDTVSDTETDTRADRFDRAAGPPWAPRLCGRFEQRSFPDPPHTTTEKSVCEGGLETLLRNGGWGAQGGRWRGG